MTAPILARVEFQTGEARARADGLTSYTRDITHSGRASWIISIDVMAKVVKELAADGFQIKTHLEVY